MEHNVLLNALIYLAAAVLVVPAAKRLGLGVHAWVGDAPDPEFVEAVGAPVFSRPDEVLATWARVSSLSPDWDAPTLQ